MPMNVDLAIRGGTVVDGSGGDAFEADISVKDGLIVAVGQVPEGAARQDLDASGRIVTPGFVDIHTHYDGQAVWSQELTPSSWHGVTTVVMGNCGVGFAPCRPTERQALIDLMAGVEDIPAPIMDEGLTWDWESFPEYLDVLEKGCRDVDVAALVPHAPVRVWIMGERALRLETATAADIEEMRAVVREAVRAGALGVSTSRTTVHRNTQGDITPTFRALEDELRGLALGVRDAGGGMLEVVSEWSQPNPSEEFDMLRRVTEVSDCTCVFTLTQKSSEDFDFRQLLARADGAIEDGVDMRPVVAPRAVGLLLGLNGSQHPFSGTSTYQTIAGSSLEDQVAAMSDPSFRRQMLADDPLEHSTFPLFKFLSYENMYPLGDPPRYDPARSDSLAAIAARQQRSPQEVAYDVLLEDEGHGMIYAPISNYRTGDLSICEEMLANDNTIMGLGDGGAHVGFILDAGFPTFLLSYWGKTRQRFSLPALVRRLTSDTARAAGLHDRGRVAVGMKADLNIIDWDGLGFGRPYMAHDLPSGGKRLLQKGRGYDATILSGVVTYRNGEATGALPGRLVRGRR